MAITAQEVNKLRQMTGAGMMDCFNGSGSNGKATAESTNISARPTISKYNQVEV